MRSRASRRRLSETTSGAAPLIVDGFRRVRRSTFTEGAIMERNTIGTRERAWQKRQRRVETCNARRAGAHRPSEALHPTRSSGELPRIARERVPTVPHVAKTRRNVPRRIAPDRARACPSYQLNVRRRIARERVATTRNGYPAQAVGRHLILGRSFHLR